jgi:uncharacterized membrane protein
MLVLIAGLVIFFGIHSIRVVAPDLRASQVALSPMRWKGIYAVASLIGFALIIWGYVLYRAEAPLLYLPPEWGLHVAHLLVAIGIVLLAASQLPTGYIKQTLQHPMLIGTILWAVGHLLANGDAAGVLLFGVALIWAIVTLVASFRRPGLKPVATSWRGDALALGIGVVVTLALLFGLHQILFGVSPLAG